MSLRQHTVPGAAEKPEPSADLMLALANELSELVRVGATLQELVGGKVRAGALSETGLLGAQDADLLVQRLTELAKFLQTYALGLRSHLDDPLSPALDDILLGDLMQRLTPGRSSIKNAGPAGELELF